MRGIAIIGYGYWGPKLVRNFAHSGAFSKVTVVEQDPVRLDRAIRENPGVIGTLGLASVLEDPGTIAVAIATPVASHYSLAKSALLAGKHVLVEKPLTTDPIEAVELVELAARQGLVLGVDHTYVYHPAVQKIRELVASGELGRLAYIDSSRINLGLFQHDVNVLWDLAVHDLAIINTLTAERPSAVQAIGVAHFAQDIENIGILVLRYPSGLFAHINCSWVSPVKIRHMLIGGDRKMVVYDDLDGNEPIKIYDSGVLARNDDERKRLLYEYRAGDVFSPRIPQREALAQIVSDFDQAISSGTPMKSDGRFGADTVRILDAAQRSVKHGGREELLEWN